jgi:D-alanyl-D-alanine carboxypeptidase
VDDPGLPQISDELPELSALPTQDIPEAVREIAPLAGASVQSQTAKRRPLLWLIGGLGVAALAAIPLGLLSRFQLPIANITSASSQPAASPSPTASVADNDPNPPILGHLPYQEAPTSELEPISPDASIQLRKTAAKKFMEMKAAAAKEGLKLVPISGFRSVAEQNKLFFDVKAERGENTAQRAAVSAPPGHSEHHTGYAVDIGDGDHSGTDLQYDFEDTAVFKWLKENAAYYSFEMSFPKNNPMRVSYEPWHWRFVGDQQSLETFYRARTELNKQSTNSPTDSTSNSTSNPNSSTSTNSESKSDSKRLDSKSSPSLTSTEQPSSTTKSK